MERVHSVGHDAPDSGIRPTTACVVHRIKVVRDTIAGIIEGIHGLNVVTRCASGEDALAEIGALQPDVVVLDVSGADAGDVMPAMLEACASCVIVVWGITLDESSVVHYAGKGASGYITCDDSEDQWLAAVQAALRGELSNARVAGLLNRYLYNHSILLEQGRKVRALRSQGAVPARDESVQLTSREEDVVKLIDQGLSNKEIARELKVELSTVKNHVHSILSKFRVSRRINAAAEYRSQNVRIVRV